MLYVVGDVHGDNEFKKLGNTYFRKIFKEVPTENDIILQVGDFGFIWDQENNITPTELYLKEWISKKPWRLVTAGGNHENWDRIKKLPFVYVDWLSGFAYEYIKDKVYYAERGTIYTIEDKTFFFMGGAASHDKEYRIEGISIWEDEVPSMAEMDKGIKVLEEVGWKVDYVITHTLPRRMVYGMKFYNIYLDPTIAYLDNLVSFGLSCNRWYGGHFHTDVNLNINNINYTCIYDKIYKITD